MMNYKVSFTACGFSKQQLDEWVAWLQTNAEITNVEVSDASDAEDSNGATKRVNRKHLGG